MGNAVLRGERLTILRDLEGLTQAALADFFEVSQSFLSQVERGNRPMPRDMALAACQRFSLPEAFFAAVEGPAGTGEFTFRKKSSALVRDERRIKALHVEAARLFHAVSEESGLPPAELPDPDLSQQDPEACAEVLRERSGLGPDQPIVNMTRFTERLGVGVILGLDAAGDAVSDHTGISRPSRLNDRPLVAVVPPAPGAIQRISVGHELGHLIFDRDAGATIRGIRSPEEARAFRFAGALLLPAGVVRSRITENLTLHAYLRVKADYGISVPAILRRARDLAVISAARYRSLSIQLASMGWRDQSLEPVEVATERPTLLHQALTKLAGDQGAHYAARRWGISAAATQHWVDIGDESPTVLASVTPIGLRRTGSQNRGQDCDRPSSSPVSLNPPSR